MNTIILGILQGIFEWLPVSSEGIVTLVSPFLKTNLNPIDIAIFLHLGTLLATLIYFNKEWKSTITNKNPELSKFLIIATCISLPLGFMVYQVIHNVTIGTTLLLIIGTGLIITSYLQKRKIKVNLNNTKVAIVTGILQALAVIPGLSRSASTIFGLSLSKKTPKEILTYSYMMSAPVILAASIYLLIKEPLLLQAWPALVSSFIVGLVTLHVLIKLSQRINFSIFTLIAGLLCYIGVFVTWM
jgi:undecaprenyl-diphosphatase